MTADMKVLVVEDQTLVRQGLVQLLSLASGIEVVAEAADGEEALSMARELKPDLLLLDVRLPKLDGLDVLRILREEENDVPVVMLTTFSETAVAVQCLRYGAHSYMLKDVEFSELLETMRAAVKGERTIHTTLPRQMMFESIEQVQSSDLTLREQDVLRLLASGYANKQIAQALRLQEGTVKNHVSNILMKLGVRDRTQAVLRALERGWL